MLKEIGVIVDMILHPAKFRAADTAMLLRADEAYCSAIYEHERLERSVKRLEQLTPMDETDI